MRKKQTAFIVIAIGCVLVLTLLTGYVNRSSVKMLTGTAFTHLHRVHYTDFPVVDDGELSATQKQLIQISRQEYEKKPVSYDDTVLSYTDGNKEAWCANFASWLMRQVGQPYKNPDSDGWRIPGVLTLQSYYQSEGRYRQAGAYKPQIGDVAFYIGKHGPLGMMNRQHVAIVISTDGQSMTTLGGNEDGHMLIKTQSIRAGDHNLVGYGTLQ